MENSKPLVCITGITGFIGMHVCKQFLESRQFKVRGTVRSTKNEHKIAPLRKAFGKLYEELELVEADLMNEQSMVDAMKGCTYIVHTASPFPIEAPKSDEEVMQPAVNGVTYAIKGALQNGVKRVVITSSTGAIDQIQNKTHFTPDDWSEPDYCQPMLRVYFWSKIKAEKRAWEMHKEAQGTDREFDLITICPSLVSGPNLNSARFSSGDFFKAIMMRYIPAVPLNQMGSVDVRDVAKAHLNAILVDEAKNRRFILARPIQNWFHDFGREFKKTKFGRHYYGTQAILPYFFSYLGYLCGDQNSVIGVENWGIEKTFDVSATQQILKIDFISIQQSLSDMAQAMIDTEYMPDLTQSTSELSFAYKFGQMIVSVFEVFFNIIEFFGGGVQAKKVKNI